MLNSKNFLPLTVASTNCIRPEFTGLHVTPEYTEATDSYRLIRVSRPTVDPSAVPSSVLPLATPSDYIMSRELADKIRKALPKKSSLPVLLNAFENESALDALTFAITDANTVDRFTGKKIDGTYPDVSSVIPLPEDATASVSVDCDYLSSLLDACKKFGSPRARLTFNGSAKPLTVVPMNGANADGQTFLGLLMPIRD